MKSLVQWRTVIVLALGTTAIISSVVAILVGNQEWDGLLLNLGTELVGAVVAYVVFEMAVGALKRREVQKADLVMQMGSPDNSLATAAAQKLRGHGWLCDGSLQGANLVGASLQEGDLSEASLGRADLRYGRLSGANLRGADLRGAKLREADLSEADLGGADLRAADLWEADLRGSNLSEANLSTADLSRADMWSVCLLEADLSRATLEQAIVADELLDQARSLKGAIMPGGTVHD